MSKKTFVAALLIAAGPALVLLEDVLYHQAEGGELLAMVDWWLKGRPYHLFFVLLPILGLIVLMAERRSRRRRA